MRARVLKSFGIVDKCRRKIAHKKEKQRSVYIQRGVEEKFRFGAAAEGIESEFFLEFHPPPVVFARNILQTKTVFASWASYSDFMLPWSHTVAHVNIFSQHQSLMTL
jgi:hypothetical protein